MMKTVFFSFIFFGVFFISPSFAQENALIPHPEQLLRHGGYFELSGRIEIRQNTGDAAWDTAIAPLIDCLKLIKSVHISQKTENSTKLIHVLRDSAFKMGDSYSLLISPNKIEIHTGSSSGVFYASQTLIQLLTISDMPHDDSKTVRAIPCLYMKDSPRFPYRGLMIDVARHYMPIAFIHQLVDRMASYKLNKLHLHLTDDQGWRMEIKKYPLLTAVGANRNGTLKGRYPGQGSNQTPHGGYYTQEELKALVAYARQKQIDIIPEIDMPGHMSAAIAAYPYLSCFPDETTAAIPGMMATQTLKQLEKPGTKVVQESWGVFTDVLCPTEQTFQFMEDVLDEVMQVFPSQYVHIGGDECPKDAWKRSDFCQSLIREKSLKDEHGLQSHFIRRMEAHVNKRGRSIIGWDEILEGGLAPNATVMSWRGISGGIEAARQGHDVIMSPVDYCYLNLYQSEDPADSIAWGGLTTLKKVYGYEPVPSELDSVSSAFIIGIQANLWSEYVTSKSLAEYMLFPRLLAIAETGWSRNKPSFENFTASIQKHVGMLRQSGVNSSEHIFEIAVSGKYESSLGVLHVVAGGVPPTQPLYYSINRSPKKLYAGPIPLESSAQVKVFTESAGRQTDQQTASFRIHKAIGFKLKFAQPPSPPYHKGGDQALLNGISGSTSRFTDPEWLGWNGADMEGVVDLKRPLELSVISTRIFHAPDSWVWKPSILEVYRSDNGFDFTLLGSKSLTDIVSTGVHNVSITFNKSKFRFVKVIVRNKGKIPDGSPGAGNPSWMFIDELEFQ